MDDSAGARASTWQEISSEIHENTASLFKIWKFNNEYLYAGLYAITVFLNRELESRSSAFDWSQSNRDQFSIMWFMIFEITITIFKTNSGLYYLQIRCEVVVGKKLSSNPCKVWGKKFAYYWFSVKIGAFTYLMVRAIVLFCKIEWFMRKFFFISLK